jgi:hypothetical protein
MKETKAREGHGDAVFVAGFDDTFISLRPTRLYDVGDTVAGSSINTVSKGKEGI